VIEDCCHTYDSLAAGRRVGTYGDAAFYSFEWGKPLVLGIGGALICNDRNLKEHVGSVYREAFRDPPLFAQLRLEAQYCAFRVLYRPSLYWPVRRAFRRLSSAGVTEGNFHGERGWESVDYGYRMAPLLKRRLSRKIAELQAYRAHSAAVAERYRVVLTRVDAVHPVIRAGDEATFARYPLRVGDKRGLMQAAEELGAEIADWYTTPVHPVPVAQSGLVGLDPAECPQACRRVLEIVSLPTNLRVGERDIDRIAGAFLRMSGS
jgi:dTDP-4-amino-4,6-dideoxygalactose transaminase